MVDGRRRDRCCTVWLVLIMLLTGGHCFAQGAPAKRAPATPGSSAPQEPEQLAAPEDPAVAAILASNPLSPRERVRAAIVLLRLNRPDLVKQMLARTLESPLDQITLNALHEEFGSPPFFQFASRSDLAPEGSQLAQLVFDAVRALRSDPSRISALVSQLCEEGVDRWAQAARQLIDIGPPVLVPLLSVLSDESRSAAWPRVCTVLAELRPDVNDAVLALLVSLPDDRRQGAIFAVRALRIEAATPFLLEAALQTKPAAADVAPAVQAVRELLGRVPSRAEAIRMILRSVDMTLQMPVPLGGEVQQLVRWDPATNQIVPRNVSFELWRRERASLLAQAAFRLNPEENTTRDLAAVLTLERVGYANREEWDQPAPPAETDEKSETESAITNKPSPAETVMAQLTHSLAGFSPSVNDVNRWLGQCLERKYYAGAWAAVVYLNAKDDTSPLQSGVMPPLVQAALAPDRSLRFSALAAIMKLAPGGTFRGAGQVWQELLYFARGRGVPAALVASPLPAEASQLAAYLKLAGIGEVITVFDGGSLLRVASLQPDVEVILLSGAVQNPPLELTLQRLRANPRLARTPVIVYADVDWLPKADRVCQTVPHCLSVARPVDAGDLAALVKRAQLLSGVDRTPAAERKQQADKALAWLEVLSERLPPGLTIEEVEKVARSAIRTPGQEIASLEILKNLNTPSAQLELVEAASRESWPIELRMRALSAFRECVERRGVQLTTEQILRQYDRYNQSAHRSPEIQRLLGLILDCIEAPSQARTVDFSTQP